MPLYEGVGLIADRQAVIIDLGTAYTKCGFATEQNPRFIFPSEIADYKSDSSTKVVDFNRSSDQQFDIFVNFFFQIYYKKLLVNPKERRVVILESVLSPTSYRNLLAKVLFEHFEVPSIVFLPCHLAACFPLGTQSALVVDIGYVETLVLPIYEGIPMLNCWQASPIGQKKIFENLATLLKKYGKVNTTAGTMNLSQYPELLKESILEDIKVRTCFFTRIERGKKIQAALMDESGNILDRIEKPPPNVEYPLEGDKVLNIDGFLREAACETLFKRDVDEKSISQLILDSVLKCPIDLRRYFLDRIHVIGGACMSRGFYDRLKSDLLDLLSDQYQNNDIKLKSDSVKFFKSPVKENCVAWLGGAIFGGLEILPHRSISRDDFKANPEIPDWTTGNVNEIVNNNGLQHQR